MGLSRLAWSNILKEEVYLSLLASSEVDGYPVENLASWYEDEVWQGEGSNTYTIEVEYSAAKAVTCIAIAGHNLHTCGARVKVEGYDEISSSAPNLHTVQAYFTPGDDFTVVKFTASASYKGYFITIDNNAGPNFSPSIGILFLGQYFEFERHPQLPFDPDETEDESAFELGEAGRSLGVAQGYTLRKMNLRYPYCSHTWVKNTWIAFHRAHRYEPFFFAWDADETSEVYLMRLANPDMTMPFRDTLFRGFSLKLEGVLEE